MQNQDVRHKNPRKSAQSGNALWFILVAIGLLAALSLTLTRNSGKMADNLDQEQARVLAERLARDLTSLASTVQRLQTVNGCGEEEISFESAATGTTYANPKSPVSGTRAYTCHVYRSEGGGLSYERIPEGVIVPDPVFDTARLGWFLTGANSVPGVGPEGATQTMCASNCAELAAATSGLYESVCTEYNKLAGVDGIPLDPDDYDATVFTGDYEDANTLTTMVNEGNGQYGTDLYGVKTACYQHNIGFYILYKTLIAR